MVEHRTVAPRAEGSNPFAHPGRNKKGMHKISTTFLWTIIFLSAEAMPCRAASPREAGPSSRDLSDPIVRFVVGAVGGASEMTMEGDNDTSWSYAAGALAEMSLAAPGLTPILQAGYLVENKHWFHSIPIDIGGRFVWKKGMLGAYLSGGLSVFVMDKKVNDPTGGSTGDWAVSPLVYLDLGTRIMFRRHFGLEIRFEYRTYIVINVLSFMAGFAL
jgi:hypothetical protein